MAASVSSPADVVNLALARIGYKLRISDLYDGSAPAKVALTVYAQTRDELLSDGNWEFAERNTPGVLLKQAPVGGYIPPTVWTSAYPALPWMYSYQFPSDALKVRAVKTTPLFGFNPDPQAQLYSIDNDNGFAPPQRVVLCNLANAIIVYTGQVTDPTTWDVAFVEAMAAAVGRRMAPQLVGLDGAKLAASDEQVEGQIARMTQE